MQGFKQMYVLNYLCYSDHSITILEMTDTKEKAEKMLKTKAVEFVTKKDGEKNSLILNDPDHSSIFSGYFLTKLENNELTLELNHKEQKVNKGYLSSSIDTIVKKMGSYSISRYSGTVVNQPVETKSILTRKPKIDPLLKSNWDLINDELNERFRKQKKNM